MSIVYLNGDYVEEKEAKVSIFDRGFLFSDSVYEVTALINGHPVDAEDHFKRLELSCEKMGFACPLSLDEFLKLHQTLVDANEQQDGVIYLQITRGVAARNFIYPESLVPTVIAFFKAVNILDNPLARTGIKIKTTPDQRWARCDIKTTQLTAQSMAKTEATRGGFDDAWMVRGDFVTEGTSNNAFIVDDQGVIVTRELSSYILEGVTRKAIIEIARTLGFKIEERAFTVKDALAAQEAFSTSTSTIALPVIEIDGRAIGNGKPGPICSALRKAYIERVTP